MLNGKKEIKRRRKAMKPTKQSNLHDNKGFGNFSAKIQQNAKKGDRKMKHKQKLMMLGLLCVGMIALIIPQQAKAAGTASNTDITNQATVSYEVGNTAQTPILSNTTTFKVDNKVDLTVTEVSSASVIPGSNDQVLVFSITNTGNTTQGYRVATSDGTDDFDMTSVRIYRDADASSTVTGGDVEYTADTNIFDIVADGSIQVLVVANTPLAPTNGQTAVYNLIATTTDAGSASVTTDDSGIADDPDVVQVVFADADTGTDAGDGLEDGKHSADAIYTISSSAVSIAKSSTVIRDPFNDGTDPKHIPGAYIQYVVTISNAASASASATLTTITDTLDANTAIDPNLIVGATGNAESADGSGFKVDLSGTGRGSGAVYFTTASADGVEHDGSATGGTVTATMATVLPADGGAGYTAGELKAGESVTLTFNVIIQ
jgi:hypothetical protein